MNCILCDLSKAQAVPALFTVFGLSVCQQDANDLVEALVEGASVRDVLREAKAGEWG